MQEIDNSTNNISGANMVQRFERFSFAIMEIFRHWHKITADEMEKYGLKGTHSMYLAALYREEGGITATQLCDICGKDKGDVSRAVAIMEQKGLVVKTGSGANLYRTKITLTPQGRTVAEFVRSRAALAVERAGSGISEEDREVLYRSLDIIATNLGEISKEGLPE